MWACQKLLTHRQKRCETAHRVCSRLRRSSGSAFRSVPSKAHCRLPRSDSAKAIRSGSLAGLTRFAHVTQNAHWQLEERLYWTRPSDTLLFGAVADKVADRTRESMEDPGQFRKDLVTEEKAVEVPAVLA